MKKLIVLLLSLSVMLVAGVGSFAAISPMESKMPPVLRVGGGPSESGHWDVVGEYTDVEFTYEQVKAMAKKGKDVTSSNRYKSEKAVHYTTVALAGFLAGKEVISTGAFSANVPAIGSFAWGFVKSNFFYLMDNSTKLLCETFVDMEPGDTVTFDVYVIERKLTNEVIVYVE